MTLLHIHSHHLLGCKEGIIHSQVLSYNMIISEDHILQEDLNDLTHSTCLHISTTPHNKNKKTFTHNHSHLLSQRVSQRETNILPIVTPFSDIGKLLTTIIHRNWHNVANDTTLSTIWSSKPFSAYTKSSSIHNHLFLSAQTYGSLR